MRSLGGVVFVLAMVCGMSRAQDSASSASNLEKMADTAALDPLTSNVGSAVLPVSSPMPLTSTQLVPDLGAPGIPSVLKPTPSSWPSLGLTPDEIATIPSATPALKEAQTTDVPSLSGGKWSQPPSQTLEDVFARRVHQPVVQRAARTPGARNTLARQRTAKLPTPIPARPPVPGAIVRPLPTPPPFKQLR